MIEAELAKAIRERENFRLEVVRLEKALFDKKRVIDLLRIQRDEARAQVKDLVATLDSLRE